MKTIGLLDWTDLSALVVVLGFVGGVIVWVGREVLSKSFVSHREHGELVRRMVQVENRLSPVEVGIAVLTAKVESVKESTIRTEHMVTLLLDHQINEEKVS